MEYMKKGISFIICTVMVICTVLSVDLTSLAAEVGQDDVDSEEFIDEQIKYANDNFGEATWIGTNEVVTDNLESAGDKNYYKFTTDRDGYVSFSFNHQYVDGNYKRWTLIFYNIEQDEFFSEYFYGNVDESKTVTTQNVGIPAGAYYVCVKPYYAWSGGDEWSDVRYNLRVNYTVDASWETEFNDKISTSDIINTNTYYSGSLRTSADKDYYCFVINEDGVVNIDFKHNYVDGDNKRWVATLYDDSEVAMITKEYKGNVPEGSIDTSCNVGLKKGKYYIKICAYDTWSGGNGYSLTDYGFCISYKADEKYETEWNDLFSTADHLLAGVTENGNLMTSNDKDYYFFESKKAGNVTFKFAHEYIDGNNKRWVLTVYDVNENKLLSQDVYGNDINKIEKQLWLDAGKYYIKLNAYDTWSGGNGYSLVPYYLTVYYNNGQVVESQTMYRLYNPNSGEHFYTADVTERDHLSSIGWSYEGEAWSAPVSSNTPVYRLYNPNNGDHHYTTGEGERDMLAASGWNYEGIGWYSDDYGGTPLNRLYNPYTTSAGAHHYTVDGNEVNSLVAIGWQYEGVGWYGL